MSFAILRHSRLDSIAMALEVRIVGRAPDAREGVVAVAGSRLVAVFEKGGDTPVFTPPNAVSIAFAGDRIVAWRVEKLLGASGVGRGDFAWTVETYAWPAQTLVASHEVRSRDVIAWHWPIRLTCPKAHDHRLVVLEAGSEDGRAKIHLATRDDGTVLETLDREAALAAIGKATSKVGAAAYGVRRSKAKARATPIEVVVIRRRSSE